MLYVGEIFAKNQILLTFYGSFLIINLRINLTKRWLIAIICAENLRKDIAHLTEVIGVRLAGSPAEKQAAEYLRNRFLEYTPHCVIEEFPIMQRVVEQEKLEILMNGEWISFPASLLNSAPSTDGKPVEADLVFFNAHTDYNRPDFSYMRGKGVIHYGIHIKREDDYRRLMEAKPAFLLMVDTRYTSSVPLADGLFPAYVKKFGAVPTMDVAFFDAWKWCAEGATRARLTVSGGVVPSTSYNVIAEIPGTDPKPFCIYGGGHIDSQAYSLGADDNASGCSVMLEMARVLSQTPHRHTIRLIAFGSEEQLSVGSAQYIRRHREEIAARGRFMCNFDSCGSLVGWDHFIMNADPALRDQLTTHYNTRDIYYEPSLQPDPTNDLFPFTVLGVPGFTVMRRNCESGKFYHHTPKDTLDKLSPETLAKRATATVDWINQLANSDLSDLPGTDPATQETVQLLWNTTYGGW